MGCGVSMEMKEGRAATLLEKKGGASKEAQDYEARKKKKAADENKDFEMKMRFLEKVPLMRRLPKDQHPLVASGLDTQTFWENTAVVTQGDSGDRFFVIKSGEASVHIAGEDGVPNKVATLKAGDYFGENALLRDEPRAGTVRAETELDCFVMTRAKFQELGLKDKLQFANRKAVGAGGPKGPAACKPPSEKSGEDSQLIAEALRNNENLAAIVSLDDDRIKKLTDIAWKEDVAAGEEIITKGDLNADYFYIVAKGSFDALISAEEAKEGGEAAPEEEATQVACTYQQGGSFGELALLYLVPRAATVKAREESVVWVIDRASFKKVLMKVSDEQASEYVRLLDQVSILEPLLREEKAEVANALVEMHFAQDDVVLTQGEPGNAFFILHEGTVDIVKDGKVVSKLEASERRGTTQFFGEKALMDDDVRQATVRVTSDSAKVLVLDRGSFDLLLGPLKDIIERSAHDGPAAGKSLATRRSGGGMPVGSPINEGSRDKILRKDLQRVGLLGCGGYGTVELFEHRETKESYALKGISKGYIVKTKMEDGVTNEKNILMMTNSEFIIKLHETYNGKQSVYFLLEPALGGELYATYNRKGLHGSVKHARFYCAGTALALEHLHERRIIYRDLKPENLLLTELGHVKLTDMGLAKFVIGKTFTTCGTPDYFAPEVIASTGHTSAVDWWTLGILLFELMSGHPPFESASPMQICSKVRKGINKVSMPPKCQGEVGDLIKSLLKTEPSERLPCLPGGTKNLKQHAWYRGFDWDAMDQLQMEPPYKPVVKSKSDLANFGASKEDRPTQIPYVDNGTGWDRDFATSV